MSQRLNTSQYLRWDTVVSFFPDWSLPLYRFSAGLRLVGEILHSSVFSGKVIAAFNGCSFLVKEADPSLLHPQIAVVVVYGVYRICNSNSMTYFFHFFLLLSIYVSARVIEEVHPYLLFLQFVSVVSCLAHKIFSKSDNAIYFLHFSLLGSFYLSVREFIAVFVAGPFFRMIASWFPVIPHPLSLFTSFWGSLPHPLEYIIPVDILALAFIVIALGLAGRK